MSSVHGKLAVCLVICALLGAEWSAVPVLSEPAPPAAADVFINESVIMGVTRADPARVGKAEAGKKELTLSEVLRVLTTYKKVSREVYSTYHHLGATDSGSVTTRNGVVYLWQIEPDCAAVVIAGQGERQTTYLLAPRLLVKTGK